MPKPEPDTPWLFWVCTTLALILSVLTIVWKIAHAQD